MARAGTPLCGSAALGAMWRLIKRRNLQGASEQVARVGTARLVSCVGCASSPFTSLRSELLPIQGVTSSRNQSGRLMAF